MRTLYFRPNLDTWCLWLYHLLRKQETQRLVSGSHACVRFMLTWEILGKSPSSQLPQPGGSHFADTGWLVRLGFGNPSISKARWGILMSSWGRAAGGPLCFEVLPSLFLEAEASTPSHLWPASWRADSTPRFNVCISKNIDSTGLLGSLDEFIRVGCLIHSWLLVDFFFLTSQHN